MKFTVYHRQKGSHPWGHIPCQSRGEAWELVKSFREFNHVAYMEES